MLHHRHQHGRHAKHRIGAIGGHQLDHQPGIEGLDQHLGGALRDRADHATDATAGMEKRHGGNLYRAVGNAGAVRGVRPIVDEPAMVKQRSLGETCRP